VTIHYVSFTDGVDTNTGLTPTPGASGPWKTISKVNGSSFSADDQILFKRGDTWRNDKLIVPSAGTSGHPIIFDAYGSGALPRIIGPSALGAWNNTGGNVWNITVTQGGAPQATWFVHGDGSINWGNKAATLGALAAEYDWFWAANVLSVFSPTDPGTRYASVEPANNITNQGISCSFNYVTIKNIESAYWGGYGIGTSGTGIIVDSCNVHHIGVKNGSEAEGISFYACTDSIARNNIVNNSGNHGIAVSCSNAGLSTTNMLIEHNTVYDSYHSMIDNQCQAGTTSGIVIRYNYVYISTVYDTANFAAGGIWILGEFGHDMAGVQIYNNVIYNLEGNAIIIRDKVPSPVIYNNTIYGTAGTFDNSSTGIAVFSLGTYFPSGVVIKNNIVSEEFDYAWSTADIAYISAVDYNCWFRSSGNVVKIAATSYTVSQLATYRSATGYDTNGMFSDPKFIAPTTGDPATVNFRLQSSSPCINAGVSVGLTTDYDGVTIPQGAAPDMGAFEFVTSGQAPAAPSGLQVHFV